MEVPELGVGIIYWSGLQPLLEARPDLVDVIEVEPQGYWFESDFGGGEEIRATHILDRITGLGRPTLVHGVGMPVGGSAVPSARAVATFGAAVDHLRPAWVSEHLSFDRVGTGDRSFHTGFLLPPRQDDAGVTVAAQAIRRLRDAIGRPVAFETGVNYLRRRTDEMPDGEFFAAVAESADCGILLDLHNLWCNERNGRHPVASVLGALPLERVWEMHLAGGQEHGDYWLDAHSGFVPDPVMDIARDLVPDLPTLGAVVFEIMTPYLQANGITTSQLADQLEEIHDVWDRRSRRGRGRPVVPAPAPVVRPSGPAPSVTAWEAELGALAALRPHTAKRYGLVDDPGVPVVQHLVQTIRAGQVVTLLPLTYRLLRATLPAADVEALLEDFWRTVPPEPFAIDEVRHLASFLVERVEGVPHLDEVVAFEVGLREQLIDRQEKRFRFSTEPLTLLAALGAAQSPPTARGGEYVLVVGPGDEGRPDD